MAKRRSYLGRIISQTWKETEWSSVIIEDMIAGIVIAVLAAILKICQWDEFKELAFLIIGTALCGFFFGFIYRLFITAAKLYKEQERKIKSLESKLEERGDKNPNGTLDAENLPIQQTPWVTTILICLSAGLTTLLVAQNIKIDKLLNPPKPIAIAPKLLPEKSFPRPDSQPALPVVSVQQPPTPDVETQKQIENFNVSTGVDDFSVEIANETAARAAKDESDYRQRNIDAQKIWAGYYYTNYQHCMVTLHEAMTTEAVKTGDGIGDWKNYFQSVPPSIDCKIGDFVIAEIGLQKNTNLDFVCKITALNAGNHRSLIISSGGCNMEMEAEYGDFYHANIHIDQPVFDENKRVPMSQVSDFIPAEIKKFIAARKYSLSYTNK